MTIRTLLVPLSGRSDPAAAGVLELVMGAYTRSRARRVIFGGVTGEVLKQMAVPLLMVD